LRESFAAKFYTDTCSIDYSENIIKRNTFVISSALDFAISHTSILGKKLFLYFNSKSVFIPTEGHKPNVAFVPGASFKSKIYPVEKYIKLANELDANIIILWGNEEEKLMAEQIQVNTSNVSISSKLTLDELKSVITQMDLVIGGDTGPTHMAWALNAPSITLFGSTPGYRNTYTTAINRVIESGSPVDPCKIDKNDLSIEFIEVSKIVKMFKELLKDTL